MNLLPEIKNTGIGIGAGIAAFVTFFVGYQIFHFFCHDWTISTLLAGVSALFVFKLIPTLALTSDTSILLPPPKPYNLTPMYALTEVKDALGTRFFGDKRWHLDDASPERQRLFYTCKFADQEGLAEQIKKKERVLTLEVQLEPIGDRASVRLTYENVSGEPAQSINELCKDTTTYIETRLKALEAQIQGSSA
jgi:phosphate/sulfate permease